MVSVKLEDVCGKAEAQKRIQWEHLPPFSLPPDHKLCPEEIYTVSAGPDASGIQYRWKDGTPGPQRAIIEPGVYTVTMSGSVCVDTSSIAVTPLAPPDTDLGADTIICQGDRLFLNARSEASTYLWNTGSSASSFWVDGPGTYAVQISNRCGNLRDTIQVGMYQRPQVSLGNDTTICPFHPLLLDGRSQAGGIRYSWENGSEEPFRQIDQCN